MEDKAKLFVGGITRDTSEKALRLHFCKYGDVLRSEVAKDKLTQYPRGFGFVEFSDAAFAEKALQDSHVILGKQVEVKRARPKGEQRQSQQQGPLPQRMQPLNQQMEGGVFTSSGNWNGGSYEFYQMKKIFVGGLSPSLTEEQFKNYFERFGKIVDAVVMQDNTTNRPRGFGFITFDSEDSVKMVMRQNFYELNGKHVEVKKAIPRDGMNGSGNNCISGGAVRGSSNQSFQPVNYTPYGPGYVYYPSYAPVPEYSGFQGSVYATNIYGGWCPTPGYATVNPRSPWGIPTIIGPGQCPFPYNYACTHPAYFNSVGAFMGTNGSGYYGVTFPSENGKLNQVPCGNGHMSANVRSPLIEELEVETTSQNGKTRGASS